MAAPTNAANVKKALANSEPSTHGTILPCQPRRATSGFRGIVLQNSLLRCERAIIKSKPTAFLNRRCARVLVLESILLILVVKIVLQHI